MLKLSSFYVIFPSELYLSIFKPLGLQTASKAQITDNKHNDYFHSRVPNLPKNQANQLYLFTKLNL